MSQIEVTTQTPRGWVSLSADTRHLVVRAPDSVAEDLQGPLAAGLVEVLGALGRDGLDALPDFALVDTAGELVRVLVGGSGVVRADGSEITSEDRVPWRDVDVEAAVVEVVGGRGGWRKPARLGRSAEGAGVEPVAGFAADDAAGLPAEPSAEPASVPEPAHEPAQESVPESAVAEPGSEAEPAHGAAPESEARADLTLPPVEEYSGVAPADRVLPEPQAAEVEPERKGLIESVPWRTESEADGNLPDPVEAAGPQSPPLGLAEPEPSADHPEPVDSGPAPDRADDALEIVADGPESPGDEELPGAALEATAPQVPDRTLERDSFSPVEPGSADGPVVLAVICPAGHHSSPHASQCRVCGRELPTQQPFQTPRPPLGVLRISTGGLVPLDRGILLGRSPRVNEELPPVARPHLVRLTSRDNDISRNHAEIILEGWHVLVRDLGSTNGTTITLPGQEPVRLRPSEDFGIEPGAIITLADEVALTYEVSE